MASAAAATTVFRSLLHATAAGATTRIHHPPHLRFQHNHHHLHHHLSLHLFPSRRRHPLLLLRSFAAEAFSSDGEDFVEDEEEEEQQDEELTAEFEATPASPPPRSRPPPGQEPGRLFVGNLPYSMTSTDLSETFSEAGRVDDVQVIYDRVTDRSRGFAFVTMATAEEASKAIEMFDGALLGGRTVKVNFPEVPRGGERAVAPAAITRSGGGGGRREDGTYKIYAGNLGWGVRADTLKAAFEGQPGLLGARVIFDRETGRSRGFGFVSFQTPEDAQAALQAMDGVELEGRPLRLSPAAQNPAGGSPPSTYSEARREESTSEPSEAEMEESSTSEQSEAEMEESNLQTTASY